MKHLPALTALALSVVCATAAHAQCLSDAQAAEMAGHYAAKTPAANLENLSDADGACTRAKFNALLAPRLGKSGRGSFQEVALSEAAAWLALPRAWGLTLPMGAVGGAPGPLIVMLTLVVGLHRSKPEYSTFRSSSVAIDTPELPTLP